MSFSPLFHGHAGANAGGVEDKLEGEGDESLRHASCRHPQCTRARDSQRRERSSLGIKLLHKSERENPLLHGDMTHTRSAALTASRKYSRVELPVPGISLLDKDCSLSSVRQRACLAHC